jgi:hypothetical protein
MKGLLIVGCLALGVAALALADESKKDQGKTDPPGVSLEAKLTARTATYPLDLAGQSAEDFRKAIKAGDDTGRYPEAPKVDLVLELRNTGDQDLQVKMGGTQNVIMLDLEGKGAVSAKLQRQITPKFIIASKPVTLAPGKGESVPIMSLSYGFKGSDRAWWTEPGDYTLAASYKTEVSPAPKGATPGPDGFAPVTVTSAPINIKVEAK